MRINEEDNVVVFDNLMSVDRAIGSDETITMPKAAEVAVACNAKGVFEDKTMAQINKSAVAFGAKLAVSLPTS